MKNGISRRTFIKPLLLAPVVPLVDAVQAVSAAETAPVELPEEIIALETFLRANPDQFSWQVHNELRHLYLHLDEYQSRKHADTILRYSVMDNYILNTLSDWHLTHENKYRPDDGVAILLDTAQRYQGLPHLWAACYVRAAQARAVHNKRQIACMLLDRALCDPRMTRLDTLQLYRSLAENMLAALSL